MQHGDSFLVSFAPSVCASIHPIGKMDDDPVDPGFDVIKQRGSLFKSRAISCVIFEFRSCSVKTVALKIDTMSYDWRSVFQSTRRLSRKRGEEEEGEEEEEEEEGSATVRSHEMYLPSLTPLFSSSCKKGSVSVLVGFHDAPLKRRYCRARRTH